MTEQEKRRRTLYRLVSIGLMTALVFIGNYMSLPKNPVTNTRIHLGNSMCLLAGLLFGGASGGIASGLGAGLFDLFDPVYITSAPYTFLSKFAMGFAAGKIRRTGKNEKTATVIAAVVGQIVYIVLYLLKTFVGKLLLGEPVDVALAAVGINAVSSSINGVLACVIAIPLYFALSSALKHTGFASLIHDSKDREKNNWFNPLTIALTVWAVAVTAIFSINLANTNKVKAAQEEKEAAYQQQIDDLGKRLDALEGKDCGNDSCDECENCEDEQLGSCCD